MPELALPKPPSDSEPAKRGRPEVIFDLAKVTALCQVHATDEEIAAHFSCSVKTLERRRKTDEAFAACFEKGRADGKISLRRAQWSQALAGNATMLIWLGKQELKQSDKLEHSGPNGGPIKLHQVKQLLENMTEEDFLEFAEEHGVKLPDSE